MILYIAFKFSENLLYLYLCWNFSTHMERNFWDKLQNCTCIVEFIENLHTSYIYVNIFKYILNLETDFQAII